MADISKIKLPSGSTYDIVDKKSGYKVVSINRKVDSGINIADITIGDTTTQLYAPQSGGAGTITKVKTTAGAHTAIDVSSGAAEFNVPTKTSHLTNDSGFISTETDPTVPSWAKASTKPSYTASEVGAVPTSRTVNGKVLSSNISLTASDVSAVPTSDVTLTGEVSKIPKISSGGVLEIRKYIDMHDTSSTLDYDVRLSATTSGTAGTGTLGIAAEEMQISISSSSTLYTDIVALGWTSDVITT